MQVDCRKWKGTITMKATAKSVFEDDAVAASLKTDDELEAAAAEGPCDILTAAGNPCVAAHSTVRALYAQYAGPLYRVTRPLANNASANISAVGPGGFADSTAHEKFCSKLDCVISVIFDQSPQGNHLRQRISDGVIHKMVNASTHKVGVAGGAEVFAMWFDAGHGYHVDFTTGVAKGNQPESLFAVMSGTHFNGACCFGKRRSCRCSLPDSCCCSLPVSQTTATRRTPHSSLCTPATTRAEPWRPSTWAMRTGRATRAPARRAPGSALISRLECSTAAATKRR